MSNGDTKHPTQQAASPVGAQQVTWPMIRSQFDLSKVAELLRLGARIYAQQGKKIGEILNGLGAIDDRTLRSVEHHHNIKKSNSKPIGELLVKMGFIDPEVLTRALHIQSGMPMVDLMSISIPYDVLSRIPNEKAVARKVVPVGVYNRTLFMSVAEPGNFPDQQHFAFITRLNVKPVYSPLREIDFYINAKWSGTGGDIWAG